MADPETPTHGLAERLEHIAAYLEHHEDDAADLRAAAAQLREKDAEIERWKAKATELGEALRLDLKGIVNVMEEVPVERIAELEAQLRQLDRIKALVLDDEWALRDLLVVALNDAWGDHVGDTHCYPEVLNVTRGPMVEADFAKGNFTLMAAGWLQRRLRDALEADDG